MSPTRPPSGNLPTWLTAGIVALFAVALLVHIAADFASEEYDGGSTSLMLGGIVGAALAGDRLVRRGDE